MKRIFFSMICCLLALGAMAVETSDRLTLSPLTLNPGGDQGYFIVSLEGSSNLYSGYNMDIHLPEGMDVVYNSGKPYVVMMKNASSVYPYTEDPFEGTKVYTHSVSTSYGEAGERVLRVACISTANDVFTKTSGQLFAVFVKATSYAKPGTAPITIDGVALKVAGGAEYDPAPRVDENVKISTSATAPLNVSASAKWSTCILPFAAEIPEGVEAYTCSTVDEENLHLAQAEAFEAYTPYILHSEVGFSGQLSGTVDAEKYPDAGYANHGYLSGAIVNQEINEGYVLQNLDEGVKFYQIQNNDIFVIPAGKCWLTLQSNAKALNFVVDSTDGIKHAQTSMDSSNGFNLIGQSILPSYKGIIIKNGHKYLNK